MSFEAVGWALRQAPAKGNSAIILIALAERAGGEYPPFEAAFPSQATLAKEAQVSVPTVKRTLKDLEERGVIYRGNQNIPEIKGFRKDRRPVVWNLNQRATRDRDANKDQQDQSTGYQNDPPINLSGGSDNGERGVKNEPTGDHSCDLQTSLKPPLNPPLKRDDLPQDQPQPKSRKKPALPLPEVWAPAERTVTAMAEECPGVDQDAELLTFRDHWWSKDERRASWDATYRNWIRRAKKYQNNNPQHQRSAPATNSYEDWFGRAANTQPQQDHAALFGGDVINHEGNF